MSTSDKASSRDQSGQRGRVCTVCSSDDIDDIRHVSVECFYDVQEVAPSAVKELILREVDNESAFWGVARRYPEGSIERLRPMQREPDEVSSATVQLVPYVEPTPAVRLLEQNAYSVSCCKSCRADFLRSFGAWARGELRTRSERDEAHCIPFRENGALVWLTREQAENRMQSRSARP